MKRHDNNLFTHARIRLAMFVNISLHFSKSYNEIHN